MFVEKVLGNLKTDEQYKGKDVDYVDIEWYETRKKIHKKYSQSGKEIGIRFDDHVLIHGVKQGDILAIEGSQVIAVNIPPCEGLKIEVEDAHLIPKVCYEIGNKHAPFFRGEKEGEFITPYDKPLEVLLNKLGVKTSHEMVKLDFDKAISSSMGGHHH